MYIARRWTILFHVRISLTECLLTISMQADSLAFPHYILIDRCFQHNKLKLNI